MNMSDVAFSQRALRLKRIGPLSVLRLTELHDKRDDFNFLVVNFAFLCGEIPSHVSCRIFMSHLI